MSFAGNLKTVSFGDVLQLLSTGRKTGALVLSRPQRGKKIFFRNGDIIAALSDPPTDEERLGQLLLRRGQLSAADLERSLKRQKSTNRKLGHVLVDLGILSRDAVTGALRMQVEEVVYGVFGWPDGEFRFVDGESPDASQILVDLNALNAMMEGARRFDEYADIAHSLPSEETVLRMSPSPHMKEPEIILSAEDVDILSAIDGSRTLGEIVASGSYGEFAASRSLFKLLTSHLVEPCPEVADRTRRLAEEEEIYPLIYKLYVHALRAVQKVLVDQLGDCGQRAFFRLPELCGDDPAHVTACLVDAQDANGSATFRERIGRISPPVRLHRVLSTAAHLLGEGLRLVEDMLGPRWRAAVVNEMNKELSLLMAQKRDLADRYDVQTEFSAALKEN